MTALKRINLLKDIFAPYWPVNKITEVGHFNFSKFHIITYYLEYIQLYSAVNEVDILHNKAAHKY